ncbi:MAG TPA: hypothetical protein PKD90_07735 [Phnomibacter sp.]|nr:hypothetical protein [Phnomibacter sp.]
MKPIFTLLTFLYSITWAHVRAQESPVAPLNSINAEMEKVNARYMVYMSEMAHGRKAKKAEKRHLELLTQIDEARYALAGIPYYKGDKALHEGAKSYLTLIGNMQRENYSKVVNMEEIAEKSYDAMEAYILFKKKLDERMQQASDSLDAVTTAYAARHNITLTKAPEDERSAKMKKISHVMDYYDMMYLIMFKASIQDEQMVEALNRKDITAIEQNKSSLLKYAEEGLQKLDTIKGYRGSDVTLKNALRLLLTFYKKEASLVEANIDYMVKAADFETIKKNFERNSKAQSDKAEVDKYNKAVKEMNDAVNASNKANQQMNSGRADGINNWNRAVKEFLDTHIPVTKK